MNYSILYVFSIVMHSTAINSDKYLKHASAPMGGGSGRGTGLHRKYNIHIHNCSQKLSAPLNTCSYIVDYCSNNSFSNNIYVIKNYTVPTCVNHENHPIESSTTIDQKHHCYGLMSGCVILYAYLRTFFFFFFE